MFSVLIRNISSGNHNLTINIDGTGITTTDKLTVLQNIGVYWTFTVTDVDSPAISGFIVSDPTINVVAFPAHTSIRSLKLEEANTADSENRMHVNFHDTYPNPATAFPVYRPFGGAGASDAWSVSIWIKQLSQTPTQNQAILSIGDAQLIGVRLEYMSNHKIKLIFGNKSSPSWVANVTNSAFTYNTWHHILITYSGGVTGGDENTFKNTTTYNNAFKTFVDGVEQAFTADNFDDGEEEWGVSSTVHAKFMQLGYSSIDFDPDDKYTFTGLIDEIAIFNGNQAANISDIYNSGSTQNLEALSSPPVHWWKIEQSDVAVFSEIVDVIGAANFNTTGVVGITSGDIIIDAP